MEDQPKRVRQRCRRIRRLAEQLSDMVEPGAGSHVCNPEFHFAQYRLHETDAARQGRMFQTATGEEIRNAREKHVRIGTREGQASTINVQCAPVDVPILSVKMLTKRGHEVRFYEHGGEIIHLKTGHRTRFAARDGVYDLEMKIIDPPETVRAASFTRRGP